MKYVKQAALVCAISGLLAACGSDSDDGSSNDGTGGSNATGGVSSAAGGDAATGGDGVGTGGDATGTGGDAATGGAGTGGAASGGTGTGGGAPLADVIVACDEPATTFKAAPTGGECFGVAAAPENVGSFDAGTTGWAFYLEGNDQAQAVTNPDSLSGKGLEFAGDNDGGGRAYGDFGGCKDVSGYDGITFYAKGSAGAYEPYGFTENQIAVILDTEGAPQPDNRITLTSDWKQYKIPFGCFGNLESAFDQRVKGVLVQTFSSDAFDIIIDEVTFYKD